MYFDDVSAIQNIAKRCETAIFVVPDELNIVIPGALILKPEEKTVITIEQVRQALTRIELKQLNDFYVVISPADKLQIEAANALLKSLEEPNSHVHFVLLTSKPSMLLPTILSRAFLFYLKTKNDGLSQTDDKILKMAKRLIVAKTDDLIELTEEISKKKDGVRAYALEIVGTAIEMLYKSYFITEKQVFVRKLPRFLELYEKLNMNGHIKLQFIATLL